MRLERTRGANKLAAMAGGGERCTHHPADLAHAHRDGLVRALVENVVQVAMPDPLLA